jgi:hypothetical protein
VGIAAVAGITCNRPDNCSNGYFVGSVGDGLIALVVRKRGCIEVDVPGVPDVWMPLAVGDVAGKDDGGSPDDRLMYVRAGTSYC